MTIIYLWMYKASTDNSIYESVRNLDPMKLRQMENWAIKITIFNLMKIYLPKISLNTSISE
jgi:hypothetical protein